MKTISKIRIVLLILASGILVNRTLAQKNSGYAINALITDVPDGTSFFLIKTSSSGSADTIDRVKSKNSTFSFKGKLSQEGELHFIKMDTSDVKIKSKNVSWVRLLLDNSKIYLRGKVGNWPEIEIENSPSTFEFENLIKTQVSEREYIKSLNKDSIPQTKAIANYKNYLLKYIAHYPDSYSAAFALLDVFFKKEEVSEIQSRELAYNKLTERVKNSFYGTKVRRQIFETKTRPKIKMGRQFPEISVKTSDGRELNMLETIKQSKYTLIDFWASWCVPCKDDIPYIKAAFEKYHSKGFNVVSIGVMDKEANWKKALYPVPPGWIHGLESNRNISDLFGLKSIPAYVLVNQNGEMLVFSCSLSLIQQFGGPIRGDDLEKKLAELFATKTN